MRCCIGWMLALLLFLARPLPVLALSCRSLNGELVCIQSLQRSAKKYWEYRVQLKINGLSQPVEIYDCRNQRRRSTQGQWQDFSHPKIDAFACSLFH
jgi:hypothetical protein